VSAGLHSMIRPHLHRWSKFPFFICFQSQWELCPYTWWHYLLIRH